MIEVVGSRLFLGLINKLASVVLVSISVELVQQIYHHLICLKSEDSASNTSTPASMPYSEELKTHSAIPQTTLWPQLVIR